MMSISNIYRQHFVHWLFNKKKMTNGFCMDEYFPSIMLFFLGFECKNIIYHPQHLLDARIKYVSQTTNFDSL